MMRIRVTKIMSLRKPLMMRAKIGVLPNSLLSQDPLKNPPSKRFLL
jgi:hypothetical protein